MGFYCIFMTMTFSPLYAFPGYILSHDGKVYRIVRGEQVPVPTYEKDGTACVQIDGHEFSLPYLYKLTVTHGAIL